MRLFLMLMISLFIISGCSNDDVKPAEEGTQSKVENTTSKTDANEDEQETEEAVEANNILAPSDRTEPLPKGKYPWEVYNMYGNGEGIMDRVQGGEVLFLFSDAEALENAVLEFANDKSDKPKEWWHSVVMYFNQTVSEYHPDKTDYFVKMKEVEDALLAGETGKLPNLIAEAKTLRGAN